MKTLLILAIIENCKLNPMYLSVKMGIPLDVFCNKLYKTEFEENEINILKPILSELLMDSEGIPKNRYEKSKEYMLSL